ncbi:N-terminal domain of NEFA-interacting nuclear protein NIP30-domain-containing protein [Xylariaceae sp. FL0016]|nr:N-terminal domain of NEFA-interacting nuclear protein NIP30-domain-containing protein [Xylariaceae sp. FL0016]
MASRFISGGTIAGDGDSNSATSPPPQPANPLATEWATVQSQLSAQRAQRSLAAQNAANTPSLYDTLQANKAAKQAAFEESTRLRNQFRALDDDEIDFLEAEREKKRAEEERARRELDEGLEGFRKARKGADGAAGDGAASLEDEQVEGNGEANWTGRKRKREKEKEKGLLGVKKRTSASAGIGASTKEEARDVAGETKDAKQDEKPEAASTQGAKASEDEAKKGVKNASTSEPAKPKLGLVDYGSDEDDDDDEND